MDPNYRPRRAATGHNHLTRDIRPDSCPACANIVNRQRQREAVAEDEG